MTVPRSRFGMGLAILAGLVSLCMPLVVVAQNQATGWEMRVCADPNNLPYSNRQEQGFENRIAAILADELNAKLTFVWYPQRATMIKRALRTGRCDMIMGIVDGHPQVLTTLPYYRSSYVFVYRQDAPFEINSFDDPVLKDLTIGVQLAGGGAPPPNIALTNRGLGANLKGYSILGDYSKDTPLSPIITAVADGDVDVAVAWGPLAGYFAQHGDVAMEVVPVSPQFEPPGLPMVFSISIGLRHGDRDLSRLLNRAVVKRWDDIRAVLEHYGVPLMKLPKPKLSLTGG